MSDYLQKAEKAIAYLGESESEYARYKGLVKVQPERLKIVLARLMSDSAESSAAAKKIWAEAHPDYEKALDEAQEIYEEQLLIEAKRERAELVIEMYRSVNSAMKRGNIT